MKKNPIIQKKKYHDVKKLFRKKYFSSYPINPKINLSLSPNHFQSDINKDNIISLQNNSNNNSAKINKKLKIKRKISNFTFKNDSNNKNGKKAKFLIDSTFNKSNIKKNIEFKEFSNYMYISHRQQEYCNKNNFNKFINRSNNNKNEFHNSNNPRNIKHKESHENFKYRIKNLNLLYDSLFGLEEESKTKIKNYKNKSKVLRKSIENKNLFQFNGINWKKSKNSKNNNISDINYKGYLNIIETNICIKKSKINNFNNSKDLNINKNRSCEGIYKKKTIIQKDNNFRTLKKNKKKFILVKKPKNNYSLYSKLLDYSPKSSKFKKYKLLINNNLSTDINYNIKNNFGSNAYGYKNKSIDIDENKNLRNKFYIVLREEKKKLKDDLIKKNIEEIRKNSYLRKRKYIKLFNDINKYFYEIKNIIEKIKKEDLLKDITAKINDDISYDTILNNEKSISIEHTFKSILNNGLFKSINMNSKNNSNENTSIIYNDFSFEDDKKDKSLISNNNMKNCLKIENKGNNILDISKKMNQNNNNCFIF